MRGFNSKLYNEEIKNRYLDTMDKEETRRLVQTTFNNTYETERQLDKDVKDMTLAEIEMVMYSLAPSTAIASYNNIIRLENYVEWTIVNGLRAAEYTQFDGLNKVEWGEKFISHYKNNVYTREELLDMCDDLANYVDKAVMLSLFEGIKGSGYNELLTLEMKNIEETEDGAFVKLVNADQTERVIPISKRLVHYLSMADKEVEYIVNNGMGSTDKRIAAFEYQDSQYIFKKINRGKQGGHLNKGFINRKFLMFKDLFSTSFLRPSHIELSGMMHMMNELRKRDGGFDTRHVHDLAERYDTPMVNNGANRNYTVAIRKVNTKEFEDAYGYKIDE